MDHDIPRVTVTVCHGVADTVDNRIPQVTVTVCHGMVKSDTVTVTVTTVTKIPRCHPHPGYTLAATPSFPLPAGLLATQMTRDTPSL